MTNHEIQVALKRYRDGLERLTEIQNKPVEYAILRDATIQRFEFTYELCWKTLKILLEHVGLVGSSPREVFELSLKQGWIRADGGTVFIKMLEDRNLTSHVYKESVADAVFARIKSDYIPVLKDLLTRLPGQ